MLTDSPDASRKRAAQLREQLEERLNGPRSERIYPIDEWQIVERRLELDRLPALESVFAVGNGYLGIRGAPEECTPAHDPGVILNGFHETWPLEYPEDAFGLARTGQTLAGAPDGAVIRLFVDDEPFDLATASLLAFRRAIDMKHGVLTRELEWETPGGTRVHIRSRRIVSLEHRHLAAMTYEVEPVDAAVGVAVSSELVAHAGAAPSEDPRRGRALSTRPLVPLAARAHGARAVMRLATASSGLELACGMEHAIGSPAGAVAEMIAEPERAAFVVLADLEPGRPLRLSKFIAYHWTARPAPDELVARVHRTLDRAAHAGYDRVEAGHRRRVADFWKRSDVELEGAPELQQAVRFSLFQLLQSTARVEGLGVPAKGVTGRGYDGHYFWDTEIYVIPFLVHTNPRLARQLLGFRCSMLDDARVRAREVGHDGALYPWRTINGQEASAWYAAGTAQYHINADIAYALFNYVYVTGDLAFLLDRAAEVLVETARLWVDLGFHSERREGRFCINGVTGPDEYTTVVDNNAYTNLMAKENLEGAVRVVERLASQEPAAYAGLVRATGLVASEVEAWRRAAASMHVPRHEELGIVLQDEHFLDRERWEFDATPADAYPLLLNYHPLELYRHQVIKQADVVLAMLLLDRQFSADEIRRTFDYYDPLTTGDSTLSACIQSVMASAVGSPGLALRYFVDACALDLVDVHGNTADGVHVASCAGTWLALVAGFGGLRDYGGDVRFAPRLPAGWRRLRFRVVVRGQLIEVDMSADETAYSLLEGPGIGISHFDEPIRLTTGEPVRRRATPIRRDHRCDPGSTAGPSRP
jgi:alpha,alpha-trehalose phosphorylase